MDSRDIPSADLHPAGATGVIRAKKVKLGESFRDLFSLRNVVHYGIIFKLTLVSALTGIVFGMATRATSMQGR